MLGSPISKAADELFYPKLERTNRRISQLRGRQRQLHRHVAIAERARARGVTTDEIIRAVNAKEEPVVFMLWGAYAQKKAAFVDSSKHLVLKAAHPSPLSAHNGFLGCRHFSKANAFLEANGQRPIDWTLPDPA